MAVGLSGDLVDLERARAAQVHSHWPSLMIEFEGSDERSLARFAGMPPRGRVRASASTAGAMTSLARASVDDHSNQSLQN